MARLVYLNGKAITETTARGELITDDSFIMIFNAHHEDIEFTLPKKDLGASWRLIVDTSDSGGYPDEEKLISAEGTIMVQPRSTLILRQTEPPVFDDNDEPA